MYIEREWEHWQLQAVICVSVFMMLDPAMGSFTGSGGALMTHRVVRCNLCNWTACRHRLIFFPILVSLQCISFYAQAHARRAMDFLWEKRQRNSNLVGTTINIHSGEWVRRGKMWGGSMAERVKNEVSQWWWCESVAAWGRCMAERPSCWWGDRIKGWNPNICLSSNLIHPVLMCRICFRASPDSGVGAGIDSYYEYLLKAYVLLGDDLFLQRFNIVSIPSTLALHKRNSMLL